MHLPDWKRNWRLEQRILRAKYAFAPEPIFFAAQTLYGMYLLDLVPSLAARSRVSLSPIRPLPPPLSLLQFSSLCTQLPQVFYMYSSLSFARFSIIISLSSSSSLILSIYLSHSLFTSLSYILSLSLILSHSCLWKMYSLLCLSVRLYSATVARA